MTELTAYEQMGGHDFFVKLVGGFYERVAQDPDLRAMYPEEDLGPAEERLLLFLEQYWGGPKTYGERRGHPRLRLRHAPFAITETQRDRWLKHMMGSLDELEIDPEWEAKLRDYLTRAAYAMVNSAEGEPAPLDRQLPLL
ncbi:globin [Parenemella sanctibonifatiensis]|uniref:Globin n=1 Tax=Parenemella sanctibonifatiensis TaxID=2016505 RepID=A0A255DXD5_9ACTN|nr:globin [Parenemella sanctibonifatiensis]OYN83988.1 globin [Parenemella sanctibonifatiensis]